MRGIAERLSEAILHHANIGLTMNAYAKNVAELEISAMNLIGAELRKETCNSLATNRRTHLTRKPQVLLSAQRWVGAEART